MRRSLLLLLLFVAWLAGPPASHAQSSEALKALADLAVDDTDRREAAVTDEVRQRLRHLRGRRGRRRVARRSRGEPRDQRKENGGTRDHAFF